MMAAATEGGDAISRSASPDDVPPDRSPDKLNTADRRAYARPISPILVVLIRGWAETLAECRLWRRRYGRKSALIRPSIHRLKSGAAARRLTNRTCRCPGLCTAASKTYTVDQAPVWPSVCLSVCVSVPCRQTSIVVESRRCQRHIAA